jgi:hypothetical protein
MDKPDLAAGVYRVTHPMILGKKRFICESDMIVVDGTPYAVLDWGGPKGNQHPEVKVQLDWKKLRHP